MHGNRKKILWLGLTALIGTLGVNAVAGGGGTGVHYLCGSRKLGLSFQLDNRPEKRHYPKGTRVLVHAPIFGSEFFLVKEFTENQTTTLDMASPDNTGQPRGLTVEWLGNSIVDGIR